ncbi:MAG: polyprenyl synthetase family protein [Candidatus Sumerlaeota bacterium]
MESNAGKSANIEILNETIVPQDADARRAMMEQVERYVRRENLMPPMTLNELLHHTQVFLEEQQISVECRDFITVLLSNEIWRPIIASIPFEKRILMLPQCLRDSKECPAELDEIGLLCERCGRCEIAELEGLAESMGYCTLVAEGATVVTKLIEQGTIQAVIGISCLSVLERAFPHMANQAIPGIAIPLLRDGCEDTIVDADWVRNEITNRDEAAPEFSLDLGELRRRVQAWFGPKRLAAIMELEESRTEQIALEWMLQGGKRWRPLLTAAAWQALEGTQGTIPKFVCDVAVAVECFHKASLIHDDIEDDDATRYGEQTLHETHGIPVALNIGDFLLGEGYRLIAQADIDPVMRSRLLKVATTGHRILCMGQGEELQWNGHCETASRRQVLEIFRCKTAPAFEVALQFGAICAGADEHVCRVLHNFSDLLGVAYQIRDDILDQLVDHPEEQKREWSPSIVAALEAESPSAEKSSKERPGVEIARCLLEEYRQSAMESLGDLEQTRLKILLHRLTGRILRHV